MCALLHTIHFLAKRQKKKKKVWISQVYAIYKFTVAIPRRDWNTARHLLRKPDTWTQIPLAANPDYLNPYQEKVV